MGFPTEKYEFSVIKMPDGSTVSTDLLCHQFKWLMGGTTFTFDILVLPLGCCDVVLGVRWLITIRDIVMDFSKLTMKFSYRGREYLLKWETPKFKSIDAKSLNKAVQCSS